MMLYIYSSGFLLLTCIGLLIALYRKMTQIQALHSQTSMLHVEMEYQRKASEENLQEAEALEEANEEQMLFIRQLEIELSRIKAEIHQKEKSFQEQYTALIQSHKQLEESFKAISYEVIQKNSQSFLTLAQESMEKFHQKAQGDLDKKSQLMTEMVTPIRDTLHKLGEGMQKLEVDRRGDQEALKEQMKHMIEAEKALKDETATLVKALRSPIARGQWGELQLKRVVEMAGMIAYCDFIEQQNDSSEEGRLRPDMIIKLPSQRNVIVDAKTPFEAYFEAMQAPDDHIKEAKLKLHAKHVRQHMMQLGKKSYWETFKPSPEFVVLFLPSETFFSAALEYDPSLIEAGVEQGVILATPITLIGLLKAIAYGWKQETLSLHAKEIAQMGSELYKRVLLMCSHFTKLGNSLEKSVEEFNKTVGSLESRVLTSARKFQKFGIGSDDPEELKVDVIDKIPKALQVEALDEVEEPLIGDL